MTTLLRALRRLKGSSDIKVHTDSFYIKNGIEHLKEHREAGWVTAKGQPLKYSMLWEETAAILDKQESVSVACDPMNEYSSWMEAETEREKAKIKNGKSGKR